MHKILRLACHLVLGLQKLDPTRISREPRVAVVYCSPTACSPLAAKLYRPSSSPARRGEASGALLALAGLHYGTGPVSPGCSGSASMKTCGTACDPLWLISRSPRYKCLHIYIASRAPACSAFVPWPDRLRTNPSYHARDRGQATGIWNMAEVETACYHALLVPPGVHNAFTYTCQKCLLHRTTTRLHQPCRHLPCSSLCRARQRVVSTSWVPDMLQPDRMRRMSLAANVSSRRKPHGT